MAGPEFAPGCRLFKHPFPMLRSLPLLETPPPLFLNTHSPFRTQPWLSPLQRLSWGNLCLPCAPGARVSFGSLLLHIGVSPRERGLCFPSHREECPGMNPSSTIYGCVTQGRLFNLSVPQSLKGQG